jgi:hypothetical protein
MSAISSLECANAVSVASAAPADTSAAQAYRYACSKRNASLSEEADAMYMCAEAIVTHVKTMREVSIARDSLQYIKNSARNATKVREESQANHAAMHIDAILSTAIAIEDLLNSRVFTQRDDLAHAVRKEELARARLRESRATLISESVRAANSDAEMPAGLALDENFAAV